MASPDDDMIKGFLQAIESVMDACDRMSTMAGQLLASQRDNKPLAQTTLDFYQEQLAIFADQRAHMRNTITKWWTLMEEDKD
jgi:hypothetical protein